MNRCVSLAAVAAIAIGFASPLAAQTLDDDLRKTPVADIVRSSRNAGDPQRGAVLFFQQHMACSKCHSVGDGKPSALGPDLAALDKTVTDESLVESVLLPSKVIRKGFEPVTVVTTEGKTFSGLVAERSPEKLVIRDAARGGEQMTFFATNIEEVKASDISIMPAGQVNQLAGRQQFFDLIRYLLEVREGGAARARELQPAPALIAFSLPEYEKRLSHARLIRGWNPETLKRGEAIYVRVCANCHGTRDRIGSLPASLRFAEGKFKNDSDPFAMYQTLTHGFGQMVPQSWMVPRQKYDVIHYIREAYLKPYNPSQYVEVDDAYVNRLPQGDTLGPEPSTLEPWVVMDYGPSLINTYEIPLPGGSGTSSSAEKSTTGNFAYKGIAMRLDPGVGGISRGRQWAIFDHDTLRMAACWSGTGFIDWNGIHFNGRHQVHPGIVGQVLASNPVGPGWANPATGTFDDPRLRGRDGRPYGPLPRGWAKYRGLYQFPDRTVVNYSVGETDILESYDRVPTPSGDGSGPFLRSLHLGPRPKPLTMLVATLPGGGLRTFTDSKVNAPFLVARQEIVQASQTKPQVSWLIAGLAMPGGKAPDGLTLELNSSGKLLLRIPAGSERLDVGVWLGSAEDDRRSQALADEIKAALVVPKLKSLVDRQRTDDGVKPATRWAQKVTTEIVAGADDGPFAIDVLTPPSENPWLAQARLTGFDFFPDGETGAVCAWDGDVWLVSGLQSGRQLVWQRIAAGLFQPLGLKIIDGRIYVTCRDQIVILRDDNGDGETVFYECFNNDHQVTEHFHEFAMGLQTDAAGNLYYAKSARHALPAVVPHHGTLLRVSKDGSRTEILANGFRAANGVCLNPDGSFIVTDQEGHWNPKNRINWVTLRDDGRPNFYGNMFGYHDVTDTSDAAMTPPLCWITNAFDRSPAELLWVSSDRWGPLKGSLLNLSYGYGKVFVVPHEEVAAPAGGSPGSSAPLKQGGLCELPIPAFSTGIMRGRFHPQDGRLYVCGMFAWAGNATQPGGFYRIRYTGKPVYMPIQLEANRQGLTIGLTDRVDPASVSPENVAVKVWSLKRTANYGSEHYGERRLEVASAKLDPDGKTLQLVLPGIQPTWGMEIKLSLKSSTGTAVNRTIHNTIHHLGEKMMDK